MADEKSAEAAIGIMAHGVWDYLVAHWHFLF
jgi:hypothetical protein